MTLHTCVTVLLIWVAVALGFGILVSIRAQLEIVAAWKVDVVYNLTDWHVRSSVAWRLVEEKYPTWQMMYVTESFLPIRVANELFWKQADESKWIPAHFENSLLPEALYYHPSWGGVIVEV